MIRIACLTATALVLAGCAPTPALGPERANAAPRPCFLPQTVVNFRADGDTTAYVKAGRNQTFELASGGCRGLSAARGIVLTGASGGGGSLCVGDAVGLFTQAPSLTYENNSSCRAQIVRQLTAEEVVALPGRLRP